MARQYNPRQFLRLAPNILLGRYFQERDFLIDIEFNDRRETDVEEIYEAWQSLPQAQRARIDSDFQEVDELATQDGVRTLFEELRAQGIEAGSDDDERPRTHELAFQAFLDRPVVFGLAHLFATTDELPQRYWRKRKGVQSREPKVDDDTLGQLGSTLSFYFREGEGRGHSCSVEYQPRSGGHHFFAYAEDYGQTEIEFTDQGRERRARRPAFEIIFKYVTSPGTLDIFFHGPKKNIEDLQNMFGEVILGEALDASPEDNKIYDLNKLKRRAFNFVYDPAWGIADVLIKKLRLSQMGSPRRLVIEDDPSRSPKAIYDFLEEALDVSGSGGPGGKMPLAAFNVTQALIQVDWLARGNKRPRPRVFQLTYPNGCNLKQDGKDLILREMLVRSGIDAASVNSANAPSA